jgi:hypothetical protein
MAKSTTAKAAPKYELDRIDAVPKIIGKPGDTLFVAGLAGTSKDIAHITNDGSNFFGMAGAMGAAVSMGLGLPWRVQTRRSSWRRATANC